MYVHRESSSDFFVKLLSGSGYCLIAQIHWGNLGGFEFVIV